MAADRADRGDRAGARREDEARAVAHLLELGYVDPTDAAFQKAERRRQLRDKLRDAVELIAQGRAAESVASLERLAKADAEWAEPRRLLAEVHFFSGNPTAAAEHIDWLTLRNVVTPRLSLVAGAIALDRGQVRSALVELEYAHHEEPALPGVARLLGTAQARMGLWDEAERSFEAALRQDPADARALDGLAALALRRKDYEAAAHRALEALERDMHLARAHLHLGIALWRMNRLDAAAGALATYARLDPHRAVPLYFLSRLARVRGDAVGAERYRKSARAEVKRSS